MSRRSTALLRRVEDGGVADRAGRDAGVVVQRDAVDVYAELDPRGRRPGRDLHRPRHGRCASTRSWSSSYFMTQAVPVDFGKFEALHAAFWQGGTFLYVPKGVTVELPFRSFALDTEPGAAIFTHTLVVLEEGAEAFFVDAFRSPSQDVQSFASARGRADPRQGRQAALRPGPGLGPPRLELHDRAGDARPATRR